MHVAATHGGTATMNWHGWLGTYEMASTSTTGYIPYTLTLSTRLSCCHCTRPPLQTVQKWFTAEA